MPEFQTAELEDRGVLSVTGADAYKLLQGLITNDLDRIEPGNALFAGLLTPQGKILFDFLVVPVADGYLIDIAQDQLSAFVKRLTLYRLRADVTLEDQSASRKVLATWGTTDDAQYMFDSIATARDPRHPELGHRHIIAKDTAIATNVSKTDYHAHRIQLGIPHGGQDYIYGDAYPHEALYDDLNGVSFTKGCFIGQEVVSRMEHRNATKKRIVSVVGNGPLPEVGTEISAGAIALGRLGSTNGKAGLALIRVDRMKDVTENGDPPKAQNVALKIGKPDWASFEF